MTLNPKEHNMAGTKKNGAAEDVHICGAQDNPASPGQIVLVFQGGGALGAYQAGVYKALHEAGLEPDWIIGTSIGAINASLIAGNTRGNRLAALDAFWSRVEHKASWHSWLPWMQMTQSLSYMNTVVNGVPGFFAPNAAAFMGGPLNAEEAGYYSTAQLEATLTELIDFKLMNANKPRLTVGAAHVCSSQMRYFDSREMPLSAKHIMASGALPPAFPPVRIDGELYWDGGILSNTPAEAVFDDAQRKSSLIFAVHLWNPNGQEPRTMLEVADRQKDVTYSSRVASHITRQLETHRLRHAIGELVARMPENLRQSEDVRALASHGCLTRMHVVRLMSPRLDHEDQTKDVDFSPAGIARRREAGYASARAAIEAAPWQREFDQLEGVVLHEAGPDGWPVRGKEAAVKGTRASPGTP